MGEQGALPRIPPDWWLYTVWARRNRWRIYKNPSSIIFSLLPICIALNFRYVLQGFYAHCSPNVSDNNLLCQIPIKKNHVVVILQRHSLILWLHKLFYYQLICRWLFQCSRWRLQMSCFYRPAVQIRTYRFTIAQPYKIFGPPTTTIMPEVKIQSTLFSDRHRRQVYLLLWNPEQTWFQNQTYLCGKEELLIHILAQN